MVSDNAAGKENGGITAYFACGRYPAERKRRDGHIYVYLHGGREREKKNQVNAFISLIHYVLSRQHKNSPPLFRKK